MHSGERKHGGNGILRAVFVGLSLLLQIGWLLLIVIVGVILFALLQTGGGKAMGTKIGRNLKEMTGGLIGKKKNPKD